MSIAEPPTADAPASSRPARARWRPTPTRRGLLTVAGVTAATVLLFLAMLIQSRTSEADADGASNALQAWDMLHGNLFLHHWTVSDVSFFTTELPQYMLVEALRGLHASDIHVAAAMTYTLAVLLAAWIAKGRTTGREATTRVLIAVGIMLAPALGQGTIIELSSPDHFGTSVPLMLIFLLVDRAGSRAFVPPLLCLLLVWAEIADTLVIFGAAVPVVIVSALRLHQRIGPRLHEVALIVAAVASVPISNRIVLTIHRAGGYAQWPATMRFTTSDRLSAHASSTLESFLTLFGADFFGQQVTTGPDNHVNSVAIFSLVHLAGVLLAVGALYAVMRRFLRPRPPSRIAQLLAVSVLSVLAAFLLSTQSDGGAQVAREISVTLPLCAALAGLCWSAFLVRNRLLPVAGAVLILYGVILGHNLLQPQRSAHAHTAAQWLRRHGYSYGLGGYWDANIITADTGGQVKVRPVDGYGQAIMAYHWESDATWYDPARHTANFLVVDLTSPFFSAYATSAGALARFGPPDRTVHLGTQDILLYNRNLLADLAAPPGRPPPAPEPATKPTPTPTPSSLTVIPPP